MGRCEGEGGEEEGGEEEEVGGMHFVVVWGVFNVGEVWVGERGYIPAGGMDRVGCGKGDDSGQEGVPQMFEADFILPSCLADIICLTSTLASPLKPLTYVSHHSMP